MVRQPDLPSAENTDHMEAKRAIQKLAADFPKLPWNFVGQQHEGKRELVSQWLGGADEDIMVCVFQGKEIHERFHRQDFFFINYAYKGDYGAQSYRFDHHVTIRKDECYIGQPYSGYALFGASEKDIIIVGVLIRKEVFYRSFLQLISGDSRLLHFFLDPTIDSFSDEFIHLKDLHDSSIRTQIELMAVEYAAKGPDTQAMLLPMTQTLILMLERHYNKTKATEQISPVEKMIGYMEGHLDQVTLTQLSSEFGYHPTYISNLIRKKTGRTFSQILLDQRMERAVFLMENTDLSIEEIVPLLGYTDKSNFHKAFRDYYGETPRHYMGKIRNEK